MQVIFYILLNYAFEGEHNYKLHFFNSQFYEKIIRGHIAISIDRLDRYG